MDRRQFIRNSSLVIGGLLAFPGFRFPTHSLRFGWVTDVHYAQAPEKWGRYFSESLPKLAEAIDLFNLEALDFVIETGDFKDQTQPPVEKETLQYLIEAEAQFSKFKGPKYHVLGNHDLDSLSKEQFLSHVINSGIGKDKSYYFFDKSGFRCIVLDACFTSKGEDYSRNNFHWTDTNIPAVQIQWLKAVLRDSSFPVVVFVHQLLDGSGDLFVNNASEVRLVLEGSGKVKAVFQGHHHAGSVNVINGILYYTLKAMVEGSGMQNNSYTIVTIKDSGKIVIDGYRKAEDIKYTSEKVKLLNET